MSEFKLPNNFPKARLGSVILKQVVQGTSVTESGILLADQASNVQRPNVGKDLAPGLKVYYNQYANLEMLINGIPYFMMEDRDVFCILAEENKVLNLIKPADEVRRGKKIEQQAGAFKRIATKAANDKDQRFEGYKKTVKKSPKKK